MLYGTTEVGGTQSPCPYYYGCGTVFSLTPPASSGGAWTEKILHIFNGGSDGQWPSAGVIIGPGGVLYGTTTGGGPSDNGTIYSLTPPASPGGEWTEAILYAFSGPDGSRPAAALLMGPNGVLYGTTYNGGTTWSPPLPGLGTVFQLK